MTQLCQKRFNAQLLWAQNSNLLVKETEECRSINESNSKSKIIGTMSERIELDGKIYQLHMSIGSCSMHDSQYLEDDSTCTAKNESSAHGSGTVDIISDSVDTNYETILDDDSVIYEMLIAEINYYKSKKNITTTEHLSKI